MQTETELLALNRNFEFENLADGWYFQTLSSHENELQVLIGDDHADTIEIDLPSRGLQAVKLGLVLLDGLPNCAMQVKLSDDRYWRRVRPMRFIDSCQTMVQDAFLGNFEINADSKLLVRPEPESYAALAYVTLDKPHTPEPKRHKTNAGVVFDVNMIMSSYRIEQPEDLYTVVAPYIDSDFTNILWGTGVGTYSPLYFSESLGYHGQDQEKFMAGHRKKTSEVMSMFAAQGVDPFRMIIDFCHDNGLKIWANDRISKNHEHDFRDDYPGGRFLLEHQDKRVLGRDGKRHHQVTMSFAYPEIREQKLQSLIEQVKYGVDGLYIDFGRKYPLIGWEAKSVEDFKQKYKYDPHKPGDRNWASDWVAHMCSYLTNFMCELRKRLNLLEKETGKYVPVAVQTPGEWSLKGFPSCRLDAMDPVEWAKHGTIDYLIPSERTNLMVDSRCLDRWNMLLEGTGCKIWGSIEPQFREGHSDMAFKAELKRKGISTSTYADMDPWRYMRAAADHFNQDADGVIIWEAHDMPSVPQRWNIIKNIGDKQRLNQLFSSLIGPFDGRHNIQHWKI